MINPKVFKQVRKALGLSQQELADAIGLSRVTINKMERGRLRRGIPDEIAERLMSLQKRPATERTITGPRVTKGESTFIVWEKAAPNAIAQTVSTHPTREEAEQNVNADDHLWDNEEDDQ